jgi:YVTN family beta-propeller protein
VKLNVATGEAVAHLSLDGAPRGLSVTPDGTSVYLTRAGQDDVLVVDTSSNQDVNRINVGPSPHFPSFTSTGLGLVNVQGLGLLATIDPASQTVLGTVTVGKQPHWTATTSDGKIALETNEGSNDVSVVDLSTLTVQATIPVGEAPRKIVLLPGTIASTPAAPAPGNASGPKPAGPEAVPPGAADAIEVRIERFSFGAPRTIGVGQTVTWVNADSVTHTVTADDDSWDSGDLKPGHAFSKTFDAPGEYPYYCEIHPHMHGQVTVS